MYTCMYKVVEHNLSIMEKKQSVKVTISLPTSGKKRWRVYIPPWIFIISSTAEFKIIDSCMF